MLAAGKVSTVGFSFAESPAFHMGEKKTITKIRNPCKNQQYGYKSRTSYTTSSCCELRIVHKPPSQWPRIQDRYASNFMTNSIKLSHSVLQFLVNLQTRNHVKGLHRRLSSIALIIVQLCCIWFILILCSLDLTILSTNTELHVDVNLFCKSGSLYPIVFQKTVSKSVKCPCYFPVKWAWKSLQKLLEKKCTKKQEDRIDDNLISKNTERMCNTH